MPTIHEKRKLRKKQTAEYFTPENLVNEILDRLSIESNNEVWQEEKTFCDPTCGNGNFLIEVLKRKLSKGHDPIKALGTIYGVDIMEDNVQECQQRLFKEVRKNENNDIKLKKFIQILYTNIRTEDALKYDFSFEDKISNKDVDSILEIYQSKEREEKEAQIKQNKFTEENSFISTW